MKNKYGINARFIEGIKKALIRNVLAEEPASPTQPVVNYEELIAKARREEKDKLYPQIEAERNKATAITEQHNDLLLKHAQLQNENKALKEEIKELKDNEGKGENKEIAKLKQEKATLEGELEKLRGSIVDEPTLRQQIENEVKAQYEVELYKVEKMSSDEFKGQIIPELVTGKTKEEVDESIQKSKARFLELLGGTKSQPQQQPQGGVTIQQQIPTPPAGNPNMGEFVQSTLSEQDIYNMTPQQWAEYRVKLGLK